MSDVFIWYGIIWVLGLVALPLTFAIFGRLPDRGYAFSKATGLLVVSLVAWWLGSLNWLPFTQLSNWIAVVLVGIGSNLLLFFNRRLSREMGQWFSQRRNWNYLIAAELVFFLSYAFILNLRSFFPQLNQSEKFFDYGFINAIAATTQLPAPDPWFGGQPMNYYYGGQFVMAVLSKLSKTEVSTGYNIGMGLIYGLGALGSYGFASNLVGLARGRKWVSMGAGIFGATLVMVLGNLYPLRQLLQHLLANPADPNFFKPLGDQYFPFQIGWPASARMIYDPMGAPYNRLLDILTEYPIYSYLNGDLHAHLLDAPFVLLTLGWGLNLFAAARRWALARFHWRELGGFLAGGMFVGALYWINGGDFPTYLGLAGLVLLLAELRYRDKWLPLLARVILQLAGLGVGLWLVYFWYFTSFTGMLRGQPLPEVANTPLLGYFSRFLGFVYWPRTFLAEFVQMFGLFLLAILVFMGLKLARTLKDERHDPKPLPDPVKVGVSVIGLVFLGVGIYALGRLFEDYSQKNLSLTSVAVPLVAFTATPWAIWPRAWESLRRYPRLACEAMVLLVLLALGPLLQFELLGPGAILLYFSLRLLWCEVRLSRTAGDNWLSRLDALALVLVALAAAVTIFCELFYVRDIYSNRFNTMFKFWYQLWVLFGFAGVYMAWRVVTWGRVLAVQVAAEPLNRPVTAGAVAAEGRPAWFNSLATLWPFKIAPRLATQPALENVAFTQTPARPAFTSETPSPTSPVTLPAEDLKRGRGWRWTFIGVLAVLMVTASAVPVLAYWQTTDHYTNRLDLNGETWYAQTFPAEYPAMKWLRDYTWENPATRGVVLEVNGMNYSWAARISTYTGLPTVVGWPFHELQWRGYLPELAVWNPWVDMTKIYETTDVNEAKNLLHKYNVRYIFVGQVENGTRSLFSDNHEYKRFSPEALHKFASFMKTVYADPANDVYIYAFE